MTDPPYRPMIFRMLVADSSKRLAKRLEEVNSQDLIDARETFTPGGAALLPATLLRS
jgi:hypothetical protein